MTGAEVISESDKQMWTDIGFASLLLEGRFGRSRSRYAGDPQDTDPLKKRPPSTVLWGRIPHFMSGGFFFSNKVGSISQLGGHVTNYSEKRRIIRQTPL